MKLYAICFALVFSQTLWAQKPYFQQEVNYNIRVTLDDTRHTVTGTIDMEYINHSPDVLPEIWMHLWGNAFNSRKSAFCRQKLIQGDDEFYFAKEEDLGGYSDLNFTVDGKPSQLVFDAQNPDIAVLKLPTPLQPGGKVKIATPFTLKIPASFSRLGHVETSYQMTQWFPKPAVYDNRGWHAIPYLDQGEFYSEFGAFDVTITLPSNYVVGATGTLQTASEWEFLEAKRQETLARFEKGIDYKNDPFPESSKETKTLRYKAEKVHDFAWFADKRFMVLRDTARLASGKTVDCWAMFTTPNAKFWRKGAFYVKRSVEFYSEKVGEYPYPHATAVHSALSAGGGMEYPMITVIGNSSNGRMLDEVITHEVGHNWFYGILASNERDHPFMDEGLNSYYEDRYMKQYYGTFDYAEIANIPKRIYDPKQYGPLTHNGYYLLARNHVDTPPDSPSDAFSSAGYGLEVYMKTASTMAWLEGAVGTPKLDAAMQDYYRAWHFRHPYPEDLKESWKKSGLVADWWFQTIQTMGQSDFKIHKVSRQADGYHVTVQNKGEIVAPFPVTAYRDGAPVSTQWHTPTGNGKEELVFKTDQVDYFLLDADHQTLDVWKKNNLRRSHGLFPGFETIRIKNIAPFQNPQRSIIAFMPWLGWNNYDKTMLGVVVYNPPGPEQRIQYYLAPGYGLGSRKFAGVADVRWRLYPGNGRSKITIGASAKSFEYAYNARNDYYLRYWRVVPQIRWELPDNSLSFRHYLNFRTLLINREEAQFNDTGVFTGKTTVQNTIYEARYEAFQKKSPNPWTFKAALETQQYEDAFDRPANYWRGTVEWRQKFFFAENKKVTARLFGGYFLQTTQRERSVDATALTLNPQAYNDYRFDEPFFGRSATSGWLSRQVGQTDGGFKGAFGAAFADVIGNSNNYVVALNLKSDLPFRLPLGLPLKPYVDLGWFDDNTPLGMNRPASEQFLVSGGFMLELMKGGLEIYFPLVNSKNLKDRYCELGGGTNPSALFCGGNYLKWISWSIRFPFKEPGELIDSLIR